MAGMLLHQDASRHAWLTGRAPLDLVVTLDDATSEIYSAFLVAEEGTASSFRGLAEAIGQHFEHRRIIGPPAPPSPPLYNEPRVPGSRHW